MLIYIESCNLYNVKHRPCYHINFGEYTRRTLFGLELFHCYVCLGVDFDNCRVIYKCLHHFPFKFSNTKESDQLWRPVGLIFPFVYLGVSPALAALFIRYSFPSITMRCHIGALALGGAISTFFYNLNLILIDTLWIMSLSNKYSLNNMKNNRLVFIDLGRNDSSKRQIIFFKIL